MKALAFAVIALLWAAQGVIPPPKVVSDYKIPPEEVKRENPVKPTAASVAAGKRTFATQCAMCHGTEGDGKGDLAGTLELKLRDYRKPEALKDVTDGEMFYILTSGKGKMPGQEDRMKPEQKWNLVNFIRSLSKKEAPGEEQKPEPKAEQKPPR
jgi:mono/diheme cytochrome c family protein